jgi:hypothetical protein
MSGPGRIIAAVTLLVLSTAVSARADSPPVPRQPTKERLELLWLELESDDSVQVQLALLALAEFPNETVALLKDRLQIGQVNRQQITQWIDNLDSGQFAVRQKATRDLERFLEQATPHLQKALADKPSLEVSRRIERLLERRERWAQRRQAQTARALALLEQLASPEARRLVETIAAGDEEAWITASAHSSLRRLKEKPAVPMQRLWEELSGHDPGASARACLILAGKPPKEGVAGREELKTLIALPLRVPAVRPSPLAEINVGLPDGPLPPYYRALLALYVDDNQDTPVREAVRAGINALKQCDKELRIQTRFELPAAAKKAEWQARLTEHQKEVAWHIALLERASDDLKDLEEKRQRESKRWQACGSYVRASLLARQAFLMNYSGMLAKLRRDEVPTIDPKDFQGWQLTINHQINDRDAFVVWQEGRKWLQRLAKEHRATPWELIAGQRENVALGLDWAPLAKSDAPP